MTTLRVFLTTVAAIILIALNCPQVDAAINLTTSWERAVKFKVIDAESGKAISQSLLIVKTKKSVEGSAEPVFFYDVVKGSVSGLADYRVDTKSPNAEVWVIVAGYKFTIHNVLWNELPTRQMDNSGIEENIPTITLTLKPLEKPSAWQREFRLVVAPELEDLQTLHPTFLSNDKQRIIREFLNRERDRMLGL